MAISEDMKDLVGRFGGLAQELESWANRNGSHWWLRGLVEDARYILYRIDQQDKIDKLEERK